MKGTILVIDNDQSIVEFLAFVLEDAGFTVHTAQDGNEGVALALQHRPPVIICDLMMGSMHGFEVLQQIRAHPELSRTVVIVASSKTYKPDMDRARELGASDYLVKPFRPDELLQMIERHRAAAAAPPRGSTGTPGAPPPEAGRADTGMPGEPQPEARRADTGSRPPQS